MDANTQEQLFKNYEVIRVMGEGSFGKVFLVRNIHTQVEYAMKKYSYSHLKKNGKDLSLQRSIHILQNLHHKCILKFVRYIITKDDSIYLLFEACKKGSLQKIQNILLKSKQKSFVDYVIFELIEGLRYLKSVSVAHRDIKPSNIAFTSDGELRIIDFDEAVCFIQTEMQDLNKIPEFPQASEHPIFVSRRSRAMSYVGTPFYMCPEMKCHTKTDERGDTWALGCIIYELITNESFLVEYENQDDLIEDIHNRLESLRQEKIGQGYIDLLEKILTIDPDQRISIDEVKNHPVFDKLRENKKYFEHTKHRFRKLLRGNYCLQNPKTVTDALNVDLIGMKAGHEIFAKLETVIMLSEKYSYEMRYLVGGAQYFKMRNIKNESQKKYIFYDEVQNIKIVNDLIVISIVPEEWSHSQDKTRYEIQFKHIFEDQAMLGKLYQLLFKVYNN